jgi:hypothetical protein
MIASMCPFEPSIARVYNNLPAGPVTCLQYTVSNYKRAKENRIFVFALFRFTLGKQLLF